jgi:Putative beta barrel porin-7 (BBP7)
MRKGFLGSLAVLAAGAGLAFGQAGPMGPGGPGPGFGPMMPDRPALSFPDGHPAIAPPGLEGMVPPGSMGAGAPGGVYGEGSGIFSGMGTGPARFWIYGDYLWWMVKSQQANFPLVTTSAPADFGVPGRITTASLVGADGKISYDGQNGFRLSAGYAFDSSGQIGVEASGFWVNSFNKSNSYGGNAIGLPVVAVPFYDLTVGNTASYVVSFPGINTGGVTIASSSRVYGAEGDAFFNLTGASEGGPGGLALLAGLRYMNIREQLAINTTSTTTSAFVPTAPLPGVFFPATPSAFGNTFAGAAFAPGLAPFQVSTSDQIKTTNEFYGANFGFRGDIGYGGFFLSLTGKIAVGCMRESVEVSGASFMSTTGLGSSIVSGQPGGLFNYAQDLGKTSKDRFAIVPEGGANIGYQVTSYLRIQGGYTFIWASNVLRPTTTFNPGMTPNLVPANPAYTGAAPSTFVPHDLTQSTEYWLHGFNLGLELSF